MVRRPEALRRTATRRGSVTTGIRCCAQAATRARPSTSPARAQRFDLPLRPARHAVPAGGVARDRRRCRTASDAATRRSRSARRRARRRARGGRGNRPQSAVDHRAVPPHRRRERRADRLCGRLAQGGCSRSSAPLRTATATCGATWHAASATPCAGTRVSRATTARDRCRAARRARDHLEPVVRVPARGRAGDRAAVDRDRPAARSAALRSARGSRCCGTPLDVRDAVARVPRGGRRQQRAAVRAVRLRARCTCPRRIW